MQISSRSSSSSSSSLPPHPVLAVLLNELGELAPLSLTVGHVLLRLCLHLLLQYHGLRSSEQKERATGDMRVCALLIQMLLLPTIQLNSSGHCHCAQMEIMLLGQYTGSSALQALFQKPPGAAAAEHIPSVSNPPSNTA